MKKLVVLTGAGISAESGLKTFRDSGGLWEGHRVEDVASPLGWQKDPEQVLEFYNQRRRQLNEVKPNVAHTLLAELQNDFDVQVITQNVDDLHERAGSKNVLHLHGELKKCRCTVEENMVYEMESSELMLGDLCENGHQLRPHIVWFGEEVPKLYDAAKLFVQADIQLVVGTSLQVYPAAGLVNYAPQGIPSYLIDPNHDVMLSGFRQIVAKASEGMMELVKELKA